MKTSRWLIISLLILAVVIGLLGCFGNPGGGGGDHYKTYGGADPKGDYVAISVDMTAYTLKYDNYTTNQHLGPYTFTKITDPARNYGFQILYETQVIPTDRYAIFAIMNGVCVMYQMFDNNGTPTDYSDDQADGYPNYAFYRKAVDMNSYQGTAYNWMNFKMGTTEGNFEVGFAAFDTNTNPPATPPAGLLYGAEYNNQAEINLDPNYTNGIKNINENATLGTSSFTYDSTTVSNKCGSLTLIGADSGDFIMDQGPNNGAGFAIRQAASKDWQSAYNGTYFTLIYKNYFPTAGIMVQPIKIVLSGTGTAEVYDPITTVTPSSPITFQDVETFPGGPGGTKVATQFKNISGCIGAVSPIAQNAYNCHGGFISSAELPSEPVVFLTMDPAGRYFCFTMFIKTGVSTYHYQFGFGIKDQP